MIEYVISLTVIIQFTFRLKDVFRDWLIKINKDTGIVTQFLNSVTQEMEARPSGVEGQTWLQREFRQQKSFSRKEKEKRKRNKRKNPKIN